MRIALAQMQMKDDMRLNYRKSLQYICDAAKSGSDIICFPEVQLTPFFPQYKGLAADKYVLRLDDEYVLGIRSACGKFKIHAAANFYIEENEKRYDMSVLIDDAGEVIGKQKMVHIAQCDRFYEQDYYHPSEDGFHVFDTKLGKIGIVVCFDRHYPESIRTEALRGAELIIIPTANTYDEPLELFQWEIKVQAFQNSVNVAMCNRCGAEDKMNFSGESIVADYNGNTTAAAGRTEQILFADIDMFGASEMRKTKPYTSLRRKELYE